jgi:hypothetical protein
LLTVPSFQQRATFARCGNAKAPLSAKERGA